MRVGESYSAVAEVWANWKVADRTRVAPEWVLQAVWARRLFREQQLQTVDGRPVILFEPGRLNTGPGPDFLDARLSIGNQFFAGDVEIHLYPSEWHRHGHDGDSRYSNVVLHVVLECEPSEAATVVVNGERLPTLSIGPVMTRSLPELISELEPLWGRDPGTHIPGTCREHLLNDPALGLWFGRVLDAAGEARIREKARRVERLLQRHSRNQVRYRFLMEPLGFPSNRMGVNRICDALPWGELVQRLGEVDPTRHVAALQGWWLELAGLWPETKVSSAAEAWLEMREPYRKDVKPVMRSEDWAHRGRPGRSTLRRLMSFVPVVIDLVRNAPTRLHGGDTDQRKQARAWERWLCAAEDPFWKEHASWTSEARNVGAAIGKQRARLILVNGVIPVGLAETETRVSAVPREWWMRVLAEIGSLGSNRLTRWVRGRMFDGDGAEGARQLGREIIRGARRELGLVQLARDVCLDGRAGCERCLLATSAGRSDCPRDP